MRVRQMTLADAPQVANIADDSLSTDELFTYLYPRREQYPSELRRWWLIRIKQRLATPGVNALVVETESGDKVWRGCPEVVGFALWIRSGKDAGAAKWQGDSLQWSEYWL
jgi:hypothetical protein